MYSFIVFVSNNFVLLNFKIVFIIGTVIVDFDIKEYINSLKQINLLINLNRLISYFTHKCWRI